MTKPNYLINVRWPGGFNCLGIQLKEILEFIELYPSMRETTWYAADLDASPIAECIRDFSDIFPKKVGSTRDLIVICQNIDQFLSGVFFALNKDMQVHSDSTVETEDQLFRDIGNAILEIRAFDTTCFEIYMNDYGLAKKIEKKFHCKILTEESTSI